MSIWKWSCWCPHLKVCLIFFWFCGSTSGEVSREATIKAQFLTGFLQFTTLPGKQEDGFWIGVVGSDTFLKLLESACAAQRERGIMIHTRKVESGDTVENLHLLYLTEENEALALEFADRARKRQVLLVGEHPGFLDQGGMIEFRLRRNKVRFGVDMENIEAAGLQLSSKLSRIAEVE